jgi:hypothetical protein
MSTQFLRIMVVVLASSFITSCGEVPFGSVLGGDYEGNTQILSYLDIADATALMVGTDAASVSGNAVNGSSVQASASNSRPILLKLNEQGDVVRVAHRDQRGNPMSAPYPIEVTNIDSDWVVTLYSTWPYDPSNGFRPHADLVVFVQKSTGSAYMLPAGNSSVGPGYRRYSRVANGALYLPLWSNSSGTQGVYRIVPSGALTAERVSVSIDAVFLQDGYFPDFEIGSDGLLLYNISGINGDWQRQGLRAVSPEGSVALVSSSWQPIWIGLDGNIYLHDAANNPGKIVQARMSGSTWDPIIYADFPGSGFSFFDSKLIATSDRVIAYDTSGKVIEVYREGLGSDTLQSATLTSGYAWNAVTDAATVGSKVLFLVQGALVPFEPANFSIGSALSLSGASLEVLSIESWSDTEVLFSGLRLIDAVVVSGTIEIASGNVTVTDEDNGSEIIQLERIR